MTVLLLKKIFFLRMNICGENRQLLVAQTVGNNMDKNQNFRQYLGYYGYIGSNCASDIGLLVPVISV
jgi:hypothetical protein